MAGTEVAGSWSEVESKESSTWRELRGTRLVLMPVIDKLAGKTVRHRTDNMNVEHVLNVGSPKPKLHSEAVAIYTFCRQNNVHLEPEWVTREFNQEADTLSRQADRDDYMFNPTILQPWTFGGDHTQSTGSLPLGLVKFLVTAAVGLIQVLKEWMHSHFAGQERTIGPPPPSDTQGAETHGVRHGERNACYPCVDFSSVVATFSYGW